MTQRSAPPGLWEWVERHRVISTVAGMMAAMVLIGTVSEDPVEAGTPPAQATQRDDQRADDRRERQREKKADAAEKAKLKRSREVIGAVRRPRPTYAVTRVVDGDSLELDHRVQVRLVGVDAPEEGECGYERARAGLAALVEGERVTLEGSERDADGRLLRYVDIGSVDAGLTLIEEGLATAHHDSRDGYGFHPREGEYVVADVAAPDLFCGAL